MRKLWSSYVELNLLILKPLPPLSSLHIRMKLTPRQTGRTHTRIVCVFGSKKGQQSQQSEASNKINCHIISPFNLWLWCWGSWGSCSRWSPFFLIIMSNISCIQFHTTTLFHFSAPSTWTPKVADFLSVNELNLIIPNVILTLLPDPVSLP